MSHPRDESSEPQSAAESAFGHPSSPSRDDTRDGSTGFTGDLYSNLFSRRRASAGDDTKRSAATPNAASPASSQPIAADGHNDGAQECDAATIESISESLDNIEAELNHAIADLPVVPCESSNALEQPASAGHSESVHPRAASESSVRFANRSIRNRLEMDERGAGMEAGLIVPPSPPKSLGETGLTLSQLCDLILKQMYLDGVITGFDAASRLRLPFGIVDDALQHLRDNRLAEVTSGELLGRLSFRFQLTEAGRSQARDAFEQCRYVGPAPVTLRSYVEQCRRQSVSKVRCDFDMLERAFAGQVIRPGLLDEIGPAVCTGQAIFLHGSPGNGKTIIARRLGKLLNEQAGDIYVPYALLVDSSIITLFDPAVHQTTDDAALQAADLQAVHRERPSQSDTQGQSKRLEAMREVVDQRWRRVRRPVITTAGELTLEMLDLKYHEVSNYYTAPAHIKANGGVFLLDDFGRQQILPRDLLNRWILPLEERIDYLTLATGKKFSVPFEQLVIFSTNLNPVDLVDDAFLRRIRHRIHVGPPTRELFRQIFEMCCQQRQIRFDEGVIRYLFSNHYSLTRPPRWSDPRDLLEIIEGICRFREVAICLDDNLIAEASRRFFQ